MGRALLQARHKADEARQERVQRKGAACLAAQNCCRMAQMLMVGHILVYLKYWTLNLVPPLIYPKVVFHTMFNIKAGWMVCSKIYGHAA